jgi:hypothetical protein
LHGRAATRKRPGAFSPFIVLSAAIFSLATIAAAQSPIRVESRQVLVPTVAFDKKLYTLTGKNHHGHSLSYRIAHDPHFWDSIAIRTLTAKDFNLYEDGQVQRIESVSLEAPSFSIVNDNLGQHPESIGTGGGRWTYPDLANPEQSLWLPWPQYVIAYVPPPSAAGSCHQIRVDVGRRNNLIVWTRREYCNTPQPAGDPLSGTEFGKRMEENLKSGAASKIDLKLQAVALYGVAEVARVNVRLEFPWKSLKHEFRNGTLYANIGAVGIIYDRDGNVAARFSDFACCDYGSSDKPSATAQRSENSYDRDTSMIPDGYQTEINLPPGEYEIQAVLSDGEKFGRQKMPLLVKSGDQKLISMSDVVLCRRVRKISTEVQDVPAKMAGSYVPLASRGVEFTPTANPSFQSNEMLYVYLELFDPRSPAQAAANLRAQLKIVNAKTGHVEIDFAPVDAAPYVKHGSSIVRITRGIPLSGLQDGEYELQVRATGSAGTSTEWQKATFDIEPLLLKGGPLLIPCAIDSPC